MNSAKLRVTLALTTLLIFVLACGAPSAASPDATASATTEESSVSEATESAPTDAPTSSPSIQHTDIPVSLPELQSGQAADFDSSKILENKTPIGGDRFTFGRFERPFNANTMDMYYSELDIVNTEVFQDDLWIYGRLIIKDLGASSSTSKYAMELDTDINGKAEWLIVTDKPTSTECTVVGVRVYQDANQDVGGEFPTLTDKVTPNSDGFETLFFDQGTGNNPDTAWARISPNDSNIIEFAVNRAAISKPEKYLVNYWAAREINPANFDLNDAFTHEQAGAADAGLNIFYPIKEVAEIDNSCRMAVGFKVDGTEPGLCAVFIPQILKDPVPGAPGAPACVTQSCTAEYTWNPVTCSCEFSGPK